MDEFTIAPQKVPPPQRMSDERLQLVTHETMMLGEFTTLKTSELLDALSDLRDLRAFIAAGNDTPEERVAWYLETLRREFADLQRRLREKK